MSDWKEDLNQFYKEQEETEKKYKEISDSVKIEVEKFFVEEVRPAFEELKLEMERSDRMVITRIFDDSASMMVEHEGRQEIYYSIQMPNPISKIPAVEIDLRDRKTGQLYRAENGSLSSKVGNGEADITALTKNDIVRNFLHHYNSILN